MNRPMVRIVETDFYCVLESALDEDTIILRRAFLLNVSDVFCIHDEYGNQVPTLAFPTEAHHAVVWKTGEVVYFTKEGKCREIGTMPTLHYSSSHDSLSISRSEYDILRRKQAHSEIDPVFEIVEFVVSAKF
jgi:hypothetical protein